MKLGIQLLQPFQKRLTAFARCQVTLESLFAHSVEEAYKVLFYTMLLDQTVRPSCIVGDEES